MSKINEFWEYAINPETIYEELILEENPQGTFWDVFGNYEPQYDLDKPDLSPQWLNKQEELIEGLFQNQLRDSQFSPENLGSFIASIEDYCIPFEYEEEEPARPALSDDLEKLAQQISQDILIPLELGQKTLANFLYVLQGKVVDKNREVFFNEGIQSLRRSILEDAQQNGIDREDVLNTLKQLEDLTPDALELPEDGMPLWFDDDEEELEDSFDFPSMTIAESKNIEELSQSLNMTPEEQQEIALEGMAFFVSEISRLLGQEIDEELIPDTFKSPNPSIESVEEFLNYRDHNPFAHFLGRLIFPWSADGKVLFLTLHHEDKEFPYEILLGGLSQKKYESALREYNQWIEKINQSST